jgi:hypothetical protein
VVGSKTLTPSLALPATSMITKREIAPERHRILFSRLHFAHSTRGWIVEKSPSWLETKYDDVFARDRDAVHLGRSEPP